MRSPTPVAAIAAVTFLVLSACQEGSAPRDAASPPSMENPVAPSRAPIAIPEIGTGSHEALAVRELDPFSLPEGFHAASGPLTPSTTTLPVDETYGGNAGWAFRITQEGSGNGGWFRVRSMTSTNRMALLATHTGEGIAARAINTGTGRAFWAQIPEVGNPFPSLLATHVGSGEALEAIAFGSGPAGVFDVRGGPGDAVSAVTTGSGSAGVFEISNGSSTNSALDVETNGSGGEAGLFTATSGSGADGLRSHVFGSGSAGIFNTINTSNTATTLFVQQTGLGHAGRFRSLNPSSTGPALEVEASGTGPGIEVAHSGDAIGLDIDAAFGINLDVSSGPGHGLFVDHAGGSGIGVLVQHDGPGNGISVQSTTGNAGIDVVNFGTGPALRANSAGGGPIARFDNNLISGPQALIAEDGEIFSDVGFSTPAADVAESFVVEGSFLRYEPGDVLAISTRSDQRVEKSSEPYSTRVIGVFATNPGVRLGQVAASESGGPAVPVGVIGVIPTKVSGENGAIRRGDLLVSASIPGHAMRATESEIRYGSVVGKALESFDGRGEGVIKVMVNVK